jgi:pyruvate/2-oxoglutarate/acetoin dehydrogenase E1 component
VITYGAMVHAAQAAAELLELEDGLSVEIVDLRTLLPLDEETVLASVRKCSKAIVLHEDTLTGGVGGEIAARITEKAFEYLDGPVLRVTAPDTPVPFSPPLEEAFLPDRDKLAAKARWLAAY